MVLQILVGNCEEAGGVPALTVSQYPSSVAMHSASASSECGAWWAAAAALSQGPPCPSRHDDPHTL